MTLVARDLIKEFPVRGADRVTHAVAGVSLEVATGETLGIVGESGCGKSTLARLLVRLEDPTSGGVELDGVELTGLHGAALRRARRGIQLVFQDPSSSLNPRRSVARTLEEVLRVHGLASDGRPARIRELLEMVGLGPEHLDRLPHELSGGQRQRVGIARALAVEPTTLVLDEAVSALDVSVRAEVMNLLRDLRERLALTMVFISHDVSMVRQISDRVAVMYLGRVVESGDWKPVLETPLHPYTEGLRRAVPLPDPRARAPLEETVAGEVPDPSAPPSGCAFHPRCPAAIDVCRSTEPLQDDLRPGHAVACHVAHAEGALPAAARR